jgi:beta-glucosidase
VIRQLQGAGRLAGLAVYGSPYAWEALVALLDPQVPAAWSPGQMALAQAELLGRLGFGPQESATPAAAASTAASAAAAAGDFTD